MDSLSTASSSSSSSSISTAIFSRESISEVKSPTWYKFGRYFLIFLAITTIVLDSQKMITEYNRSTIELTSSKLQVITFYSSSIITHLVGLGAAIDNEMWLTVICRLVSALIYQINLSSKSSNVQTDPAKLEKMIRKKIRKNPDLLKSLRSEPFQWSNLIKNFLVTF